MGTKLVEESRKWLSSMSRENDSNTQNVNLEAIARVEDLTVVSNSSVFSSFEYSILLYDQYLATLTLLYSKVNKIQYPSPEL